MELEAKEARLVEALKNRKKAKKAERKASPPPADRNMATLEAENMRLREREQALLEAVSSTTSLLLVSLITPMNLGGRTVDSK